MGADPRTDSVLDVSVVIPVRNAEHIIEACLDSVVRSGVREIIVVDGLSTDRTLEIAHRYPVTILSDEGRGLPVARLVGARAAKSQRVALVDADVVLPFGALARLLQEFVDGEYDALQAGILSVSGPGYWGRALVHHHRNGRSKNWFGLVATIFDRQTLLDHGFDPRFRSGEDIEMRWRLEQSGARIGVSRKTIVTHRFDDTYEFARGQWLADGHGSGRMIRKYGWRGAWLAVIPVAAAAHGIAVSLLRREPRWIPYYACFAAFNYAGIIAELGGSLRHSAMVES